MAKTIPTTLALLLLAASGAHADTLLLDGIEVDRQSVDDAAEAGHVDDGRRVDLRCAGANATPPWAAPPSSSRRSRAGTTRRSRSTSSTTASFTPSPGASNRRAPRHRRGVPRDAERRAEASRFLDRDVRCSPSFWGNAMPLRPLARTFAVATLTASLAAASAVAQPPGGFGGPRPEPEIEGIPRVPTAVALPTLSAPVTGPGAAFDSAPSLARELDLAHFRYETTEYFVSGTAAGKPYTTRVVVRQPADDDEFSGLVLAESMHGSGAAHMFEFTSGYLMDAGHAAVEIVTTSPQQFVAFNAARYGSLKVENGQQNEIIAQVGALLRSSKSPLAGAGAQDGHGRNVDERRHADQLSAGAHGVPHAGDEPHLRRLHADVERLDDPRDRRAADPHADDARGRNQRDAPPRRRRARQAVPAVRVRGRSATSIRATTCACCRIRARSRSPRS